MVARNKYPGQGHVNYIPQILWDVITCPCPWYLLLAHTSSFETWRPAMTTRYWRNRCKCIRNTFINSDMKLAMWSKKLTRFAPSQWETALLCNDVSHWLGASLELALIYIKCAEIDSGVVNKLLATDIKCDNDFLKLFIKSSNRLFPGKSSVNRPFVVKLP